MATSRNDPTGLRVITGDDMPIMLQIDSRHIVRATYFGTRQLALRLRIET